MNGLENLKILFESLNKQTYRDFDVVVSDNGSTDGSIEWMKRNGINFVANGKNLGFSGGNNVVLKKVRTEFAATFNDDLRLKPESLGILMKFMKSHRDAGSVQPKILSWDGKLVQSTGLILTYGGFPAERGKWTPFFQEIREPEEVMATQACCAIYRTSVMRKVGFFDEDFNPIYNEDFELGLRIMKSGYRNYYDPRSVVYHKGGFTSKRMNYPARLSFHRNRYKLLEKHGTRKMWAQAILWTPVVAGFYLVRKPEPAYFRAMGEFIARKFRSIGRSKKRRKPV
jgi:GT2 family glycosyltransferase